MGLTSTNWQTTRSKNNGWIMQYEVADGLHIDTVADYSKFKKVIDHCPNASINMVWNNVNGVWEWEISGWHWPWEDELEGDIEGSEYGTGVSRDGTKGGDSNTCNHEWVNVGFHHIQLACRHCGVDKPE